MTDVKELKPEQLDQLTDEQVRYVQNLATQRLDPKLAKVVKIALDGKEEDIIKSFTVPPYAYVGPEIEIIPGFNVRFRTLYEDQTYDVHQSSRKFLIDEDPSEVVAGMFLNKSFLAHSIHTVNGEPFGGKVLPDEYVQVAFEDPDSAKEMLIELRKARLRTLGAYASQVIYKLTTAHQVFQQTIDGLLRGEELKDILGN